MDSRNCPNCAAPYDTNLNTCPFCNTSYFDMSCIDFKEHKPFYLKIKTNFGIITQKVIPTLKDIEFHTVTTDIVGCGNDVRRIFSGRSMTTNIEFNAIADSDNNILYRIEKD